MVRAAWQAGGLPLFLAAALLAAGCSVGPNYQVPQPDLPASWAGANTHTNPATAASSTPTPQPAATTNWWAAFRNPALDSLISRAVATNLDLKLAESRIRQARAQREGGTAGFWPSADASGEYRRSRPSGAGMSDVSLYQAGLDASWELDVFGGTRRAVEAADSDVAASIDDRRDVLVTLVAEVALNYIDLRGVQQEITIAKGNLAAEAQSVDLTRQLFRG